MSFQDFVSSVRALGNQGTRALHPNLPFLWVPALVLFIIYSQFSSGLSTETETGLMAMEFHAAKTDDGQVVEDKQTVLAIPSSAKPFTMPFQTAPTKIRFPVDAGVLQKSGHESMRITGEAVVVENHLYGVSYPLLVIIDSAPLPRYAPSGESPLALRPLRVGQETLSLMLLGIFSAPIFSFGVAICFLQNSIIVAKKNAGGDVHK